MGLLATAFDGAFRDWETDGDAGSGRHNPVKSEIRALGALIEQYMLFDNDNAQVEITTESGVGLRKGLVVEHNADTTGSYGLEVHQYQGAKSALVVHCYSDENGNIAGAVAVQFDHTRSGTILVLKNAANETTSPGTRGTANFLSFVGYGGSPQTTAKELGSLTHQLIWLSYDPLFPHTFSGGAAFVAGTGHAQAVKSTSVIDGLYAGEFYGTGKGVYIQTANDTGFALGVVKSGLGSTAAAIISNAGTGRILSLADGAFAEQAGFAANGDLYIQTLKVVGAQGASLPANASDLATAQTLVNAIKARMVAHGLVAA